MIIIASKMTIFVFIAAIVLVTFIATTMITRAGGRRSDRFYKGQNQRSEGKKEEK